jgi:hypothetical protein
LPRFADPLLRIGDRADMEQHGVSRDIAQVTTRVAIVADVHDAIRAQVLLEYLHHLGAHERRHPRVHAMGDDVVEFPEIAGDIHDVAVAERDVREAEVGRLSRAYLDGGLAQVDAEEFRVGKLSRHRDQVAACSATEFQHAAFRNRSGRHAPQARDRRQACRMRLLERVGGIEDLIVARRSGNRHGGTTRN